MKTKKMNTTKQMAVTATIIVAALGIVAIYSGIAPARKISGDSQGHDHSAAAAEPGTELRSISLGAEASRRIGVTYATAELKVPVRSVRTVGAITLDETAIASVNPKIEGWVERLHVDYTGASVNRGQPLLEVYSPMLVTAQEELLLAKRLEEDAQASGSERALASATNLLESARRRLRYWDIPAEDVARIESSATPSRTLTLRAPASGVVLEKSVVEGTRIMPGMELFRIADLSTVWIDGEVFEKDLSLVELGQHARVTLEAYPGEVFDAVVTFVHPTISPEARTGRIRLELANPGDRIKPGMYAQIELQTPSAAPALLVPRSAVHNTGTRSLVFVRHPESLMPHEVTPGLVSGDEIEILAGIEPGTQVVASANFLIDAESNMGSSIGSMPGMDPEAPPAGGAHVGH